MLRNIRRHWIRWSLAGLLVVAAAVVGGSYAYTTFMAPAAPTALAEERPRVDTGGPAAPLDGRWTVTDGSAAEYRIDEILFGRPVTAVGRTGAVDGSVDMADGRVSAGRVEVDMASVATDSAARDRQFRNNLMDVGRNPLATFELTGPVELPAEPAVGDEVTVPARGELTLRGVTRPIEVDLTVRRGASDIGVTGEVPVALSDHGIPRPSIAGITIADQATMGFALVLRPA